MQRKIDAILFYGLLVVVLIMPTQLGPAIGGKHGAHVCVADVLVALLFGAWLLAWVLTRSLREALWPPLPVTAWVVVALVSATQLSDGNQLAQAAKDIAQLLLYFVAAYTLFANLLRDPSRLRVATYAFIGVASAVVLYGLYQYVTVGATAPASVGSTFDNRHTYGAYLAVALPLAFGLLLEADRLWHRIWLAALIVLGMLTALYGATVIALAIAFAAVGLARRANATSGAATHGKALAGLAIVALLALTVALPANRAAGIVDSLTFTESGYTRGTEESGEYIAGAPKQRYLEWLAALNAINERPALGVGSGNYQLEIGSYYFGSMPNLKSIEPDSYSAYLVTAASQGLLGLACLVAVLLHFAARARRAVEAGHADALTRGLSRGLWGVMCAALWHNMFSSYLVRGVGLVFVFALALITVLTMMNPAEAANVQDEAAGGA